MTYATQADLENALGLQVTRALFDDGGDYAPDAPAVNAALEYADSQVDSYLRKVYTGPYPLAVVPDVVRFAAVDYAVAYGVRRKQEVARALGLVWKDFADAANAEMQRLVEQRQQLPDASGAPANTGGVVRSADASNPENIRTFLDGMGDF